MQRWGCTDSFRGEHFANEAVDLLLTHDSGLDARYMISQLRQPGVNILSLTTIATPHRGLEHWLPNSCFC